MEIDYEPQSILDKKVIDSANSFVFALYAKNSLDRNTAETLVNMFSKILFDLEQKLLPHVSIEKHRLVKELFMNANCLFDDINSDKKVVKKLTNLKLYKKPEKIVVQDFIAETLKSRKMCLETKIIDLCLLDVAFKFKSFFELQNIFNLCLNYTKSLENSPYIANFVQGELWKARLNFFPNKTVLPHFLFHDDFECGNPLGAKRGKQSIGGFYIVFPTLPPHLGSKLENIITVMFANKTLKQMYSMEHILNSLIHVLIDLKTKGIELELREGNKTVYFVLRLILGDNLGLNEIAGFRKAFSNGQFCRICSCTNAETRTLIKECIKKLRTQTSYDEDILKNDPKNTGLNEVRAFNRIPSFHIVDAPSVDVLHDIAEGGIFFELSNVIKGLISKK